MQLEWPVGMETKLRHTNPMESMAGTPGGSCDATNEELRIFSILHPCPPTQPPGVGNLQQAEALTVI